MFRSTLVVLMIAALAASAGAYDIIYTGDTAQTADPSSFGIKANLIYFMANSEFDADGEGVDWADGIEYTGMWFPIELTYGVIEGLEVGATPIFMMDKMVYPGDVPEYTGTGIGDTWVWAKYGFAPDPALAGRVGFKLATGNDEPDEEELALGSGQMDLDLALLVGVPVGEGSFDGSIGYRMRMARSVEQARSVDVKPGDELHFFAGYTHVLSDEMSFRVGADGYFGGEPTIDGDPIPDTANPGENEAGSSVVFVNPGFDYIMANGMSLGFDVHYPLMGANVNKSWGFGLSVGFGS